MAGSFVLMRSNTDGTTVKKKKEAAQRTDIRNEDKSDLHTQCACFTSVSWLLDSGWREVLTVLHVEHLLSLFSESTLIFHLRNKLYRTYSSPRTGSHWSRCWEQSLAPTVTNTGVCCIHLFRWRRLLRAKSQQRCSVSASDRLNLHWLMWRCNYKRQRGLSSVTVWITVTDILSNSDSAAAANNIQVGTESPRYRPPEKTRVGDIISCILKCIHTFSSECLVF